jgi:hypothetical protein
MDVSHMTEADIFRALLQFIRQRDELVAQRDALNVKIIGAEQNIRNMQAALAETRYSALHQQEQGYVGLTEAISTVIRRAGKPLTTGEVKTSLKVVGFDLDRFANPSAAVSNTLQRMAKSGDLEYLLDQQAFRFPSQPLTPGEAKRMMERFRPK